MIPKRTNLGEVNLHVIYGAIFVLIIVGGFIAFVLSRSLTDDATQQATINNSAPTVSVAISSVSDTTNYSTTTGPLTLTDGATTNVFVHGTVTDNNGCNEINFTNGNWIGSIYHGSTSGTTACSSSANDCYTLTEADVTASSSCSSLTSYSYEFTKAIQYYADATASDADTYSGVDWSAYVAVSDGTATGTGNADSQTFEVSVNTALSLDSATVTFGALGLNSTSPTDINMTTNNTGNNLIDVALSGTNFNCSGISGSFPATRSHYNVSSTQAYASGTALTTSAVTSTSFNLGKQTSGTAATKPIFWLLQTPVTGVSGTCTSTITVTAVDGA